MTIDLTHDQAHWLRLVKDENVDYMHVAEVSEDDSDPMSKLVWHCDSTCCYDLTDDGIEALARYDAKWRIVSLDDLRTAVEALESEVSQYEAQWSGYPERLARIEGDRQTLARLQLIMETAK